MKRKTFVSAECLHESVCFPYKNCVKELLSTQIDIFSSPSDSGDAYSRGSLYGVKSVLLRLTLIGDYDILWCNYSVIRGLVMGENNKSLHTDELLSEKEEMLQD